MAIKPGSMFVAHMRNCEPCRDTETLCVVGLQIVARFPSIAEVRRLQQHVIAEDFELESRRHQAQIKGELN